MATLDIYSASKTYRAKDRDVLAVDRLSIGTDHGEIIGLLGASGCGKTTILRSIAGFVKIDSGRICLDGANIHNLPPAYRGVAMAFEGYALYPPLRIRDNIKFSLLRQKKTSAAIESSVREIASLLNIDDILNHYPASTSAGQQQRASLARALIRRAPLTLLDEPMSQLEPQLRAQIRMRVKDYLKRHNLSVVFVTHDQNEAIALADRIAVMEKGRLQQFATATELKNRPSNLFVAGFIGEPPMNLISARIQSDDNAHIILLNKNTPVGDFFLPKDDAGHLRNGSVYVGIRPHRVEFFDNSSLRGEVIYSQWLGDQTHVLVDINGLRIVAVSSRHFRKLCKGETVGVKFPSDAVMFFSIDNGAALPTRR